jgi:hypothetical protein
LDSKFKKIATSILKLKPKDVKKFGISRRGYFDLKNKIKNSIPFTVKKRTLRKLLTF